MFVLMKVAMAVIMVAVMLLCSALLGRIYHACAFISMQEGFFVMGFHLQADNMIKLSCISCIMEKI